MPGRCSVTGCNTKFEKGGTRLFVFPRQQERKQAWVEICGREVGWIPSSGSRLCELHFENHQFEENREDGWRKLKWNAIPSLFQIDERNKDSRKRSKIGMTSAGEQPVSQINKSEDHQNHNDSCSSQEVIRGLRVEVHRLRSGLRKFQKINYTNESGGCILSAFREIKDQHFQNEEDKDSYPPASNEIEVEDLLENEDFHSIEFKELDVQQLLQENEDLRRKLIVKQRELWRAEKQISALKRKNRVLTNNIENLPFANEAFKHLFLQGFRKIPEWPPEVLKMALEIRYGVGGTGYQFLREKMKIPLPAYSTLYRHMEHIECEPGLLGTLTSKCGSDDADET